MHVVQAAIDGPRDYMISVIVCTYNRGTVLKAMLGSLAQMTVPSEIFWELIVVDNNSADQTRTVVENFAKSSALKVRYVFERNQGLSHARNRGVQEAKGEIIVFTDDDVSIDPQWLVGIKRSFAEFNCIGVAGKVLPVWLQERPAWLELEGPYAIKAPPITRLDLGEEPCKIATAPFGGNMAYRMEAFVKYGLFRTDLGVVGEKHHYGEDTEFGDRLIRSGEVIMYEPRAVIYHPIQAERMSKRYLVSSALRGARDIVRGEGWPEYAICYFGIPRYMIRNFCKHLIKWIGCLNRNRRFYHKLAFWRAAGSLVGVYDYRMSKKNGRASPSGAC